MRLRCSIPLDHDDSDHLQCSVPSSRRKMQMLDRFVGTSEMLIRRGDFLEPKPFLLINKRPPTLEKP